MKLLKRVNGSQGRVQAALLPAVLVLLAVDIFVRLEPPAANAAEALQPEKEPGSVPTLVNPARQRAMMVDELKGLNARLTGIERKLDGRLRVEVVNFPKIEASKGE